MLHRGKGYGAILRPGRPRWWIKLREIKLGYLANGIIEATDTRHDDDKNNNNDDDDADDDVDDEG